MFHCFVKFKLLMKKLFSAIIKQIQTDNGGKTFLSQHGIFRRLKCPHTSQQNRVAERKHRNIIEMGLSLLVQSGLPSKFWVDSFLIDFPHISFNLSHHILNSSINHPTILVCVSLDRYPCYPLLRPYATHKLSFS